jgi:hypothetical protein
MGVSHGKVSATTVRILQVKHFHIGLGWKKDLHHAVSFYRCEDWGLDTVCNFPKVALRDGEVHMQIQVALGLVNLSQGEEREQTVAVRMKSVTIHPEPPFPWSAGNSETWAKQIGGVWKQRQVSKTQLWALPPSHTLSWPGVLCTPHTNHLFNYFWGGGRSPVASDVPFDLG